MRDLLKVGHFMKKKFYGSLIVTVGLLTFGVSSLSACSSSVIKAAIVSLSQDRVELKVGDTATLKAKVSKGYDSELRWFTSNENVAYVDSGVVFGVGEGTAIVTAAYGGGFADCTVVVSGTGGGETEEYLNLNPTSKQLAPGETVQLKWKVYPEDTIVTFESAKDTIATVTAEGLITAVGVGSTVITAKGSNNKVATCNIVVAEKGGGTDPSDRDIAVDKNLGYTGALTIGSPLNQRAFMQSLLDEFNTLTNSTINFTITTFEEDNGTAGYGKADSMPAVFPYASDQTLTLFQFGALSPLDKADYTWIKTEMGDDAYKAARLKSVVGFPFAADNGVVMFYNKSFVSDPSQIDTVDKLFDLADEKGLEVNYAIGNAFYAAGALMTYAHGESLYTLTPNNTSYTSVANFNSDAGLEGAKLVKKITLEDAIRNASGAPRKDVMVTITDVSKVQSFKDQLGSDYAVAPLPFVDDAHTARLGSYLGYKFLGVNNTLSESDKTMASAVAKFLCSEYVQAKRFDNFYTRPTLLSLEQEGYASSEPHVAALSEQSKNGGTIPLTAVSSELWSQSASAVTSIVDLSPTASDEEYKSILDVLDAQLTKVD